MTTIKQHEAAVSSYIENMILHSEPLMPLWNRENFIYSKPAKWNYIDACVKYRLAITEYLHATGR